MAARIEIQGRTATWDGERWKSADPIIRELCELTAKLLPVNYRVDSVGELAAEVAEELGGRVQHLDPFPDDGLPPGTIY